MGLPQLAEPLSEEPRLSIVVIWAEELSPRMRLISGLLICAVGERPRILGADPGSLALQAPVNSTSSPTETLESVLFLLPRLLSLGRSHSREA